MRSIRPYKMFAMIAAPPKERILHISLPSRRGCGGTSLLETALIIAATRIVAARRLFEFGTFLGSNTLNMALNTPDDARIFTLDLDQQRADELSQFGSDALLTRMHLACGATLDFSGSSVAGKIEILLGNSVTFDFSTFKTSIDFLFIDGGHDPVTFRSDTENAFASVVVEKPSCIMWHDYRNSEYPALTCYLDDLAKQKELLNIEDTTLCAWFNDPQGSILSQLTT